MIEAKGIVLHGGREAAIIAEPVAEPTGRQLLIKTHAVGLCGSDMSLYSGKYEGPKNYPIYFGHEWSGIVEAVGPAVTKVKPGDKVTGDCSIFCGGCEFCARDKNLCKSIEKFGITMNGASRQFFLQDEQYVYRAHPAADLDLVALSEPLAVGAHAVRRVAEVRPGLKQEKILVLGGGTIGLACFFALKHIEECRHVELFDLVPARVEKAISLGASNLTDVAAGEGDAGSYGGLYSGRGYDVIFETSGSAAAFRRAVDLLRPLGTVMALGFIPSIEFSLKTITFKAARIMGSMGGTGQFETVLNFTLNHPDVARQLITHKLPFEAYAQAFAVAEDRQHAMKVLVTF
ncbi:MAG: alcohol dehydrogenase catalytic domain-containing protein [Anaerolineae bacterium]|nr:alcohol dehydrogenase catalytic domain-containing protein [Anaerolineae bacterium]